MEALRLARYHAHGNDFAVALLREPELNALGSALAAAGVTRADLARSICHRRSGVGNTSAFDHAHGADGFVIGVDRRPVDCVRMHLLNSDGSFAETSGNGLACLALALVDAAAATHGGIDIETDAGRQWCDVEAGPETPQGGSARVGVSMPGVTAGPEINPALSSRIESDLGAALLRYASGDVGNPHLVIALKDSIDAARTAELGAEYEQHFGSGINVEFIWLRDSAEATSSQRRIMMSVWERGAGLTKSCGSGSVVAATLAHEWGMAPNGSSVALATSHFDYTVDLGPEPTLWVTAAQLERGLEFPLSAIELQRI